MPATHHRFFQPDTHSLLGEKSNEIISRRSRLEPRECMSAASPLGQNASLEQTHAAIKIQHAKMRS